MASVSTVNQTKNSHAKWRARQFAPTSRPAGSPLTLDGAVVTNAADACATRPRAGERSSLRSAAFCHVGCCDASSSDDDEHITSNASLLACAHAIVAPAQLFGLTEPDELSVALPCRFALDSWTIMQREGPSADQGSRAGSDSLVLLSLDAPCELVSL